jgi:hypothetical protein
MYIFKYYLLLAAVQRILFRHAIIAEVTGLEGEGNEKRKKKIIAIHSRKENAKQMVKM